MFCSKLYWLSKINKTAGRAAFLVPLKGFSRYDREGEIFWWPEADRAFVAALEKNLEDRIPIEKADCHINDELFARKAVERLLSMMAQKSP